MTIGKVLKSFRLGEDLTLKELSQRLGLSTAYISKLEHDESSPTYHTLEKYAKYFNINVSDIAFWVEQTDNSQNKLNLMIRSRLNKKS